MKTSQQLKELCELAISAVFYFNNMDLCYEDKQNKICYKVPCKTYGNLNIRHNKTSSITVLWNVYEIFVYDNISFECPKVFIPEFNIFNLIVCKNYLICLDDNGNVHLTSIKLKHTAPKRLKSSFQPREQGVKCVENFCENTICIKCTANNLYLCVHKVSSDFTLDAKHKIVFDNSSFSIPETSNWIFHTYPTTSLEYDQIKNYYQQKETWKDHTIIIFSFDRINIFSILYSSKTAYESLLPIKLYTCPSKIADAHVHKYNNIHVIICLAIGTVIKISLNHQGDDMKVVHLNAAVHKLLPFENYMVYTDGNTMWKSWDTFTEHIKFEKCFITQVWDFIIIGDKLLCTTFSNLIYLVSINDELFQKLSQETYCPAQRVLSNNDCLVKIMKEVSKSNKIVKKIRDEERYLTILSLSNRYDILDHVLNYKVDVFETYDDVPKEDLTLVEKIENYYSEGTFCFVININYKPDVNKFTELLSSMFDNLIVHLTISSPTSSMKTLSINIEGQLKKITLVVPIYTLKSHLNKVSVEIKLITSVTEVFSTSQNMWTILHSKKFYLNSEYFIMTEAPRDQIYTSANEELVDPIYKSTVLHFGHLYKFSKNRNRNTEWSLYAKLPNNFEAVINNETYLHTYFSTRKANILLKQITSNEFLNSKNDVVFQIGNDNVILKIINDGFTKPILNVKCKNIEKAYHIRNFLCQLVNSDFHDFKPGEEFIDHRLYSTIEKCQRNTQETKNKASSFLEVKTFFEKYQKNILGRLPI